MYYISGYVSHREHLEPDDAADDENQTSSVSEFTDLVSRGQLTNPPLGIFEFAQIAFTYYKNLNNKSSITRILVAFESIFESSYCDDRSEINIKSILRRFVNIFSKGVATLSTQTAKTEKKRKDIKRSRMSTS